MAEKQSYEELYNAGFDDLKTDVVETEEVEEETEAVEEDIQPEENEEVEKDLEQPTESEEETEEPDEEEADETENEEDSKEEKASKGRTIKWNGQEIEIKDDEIDTFIQKGFDYTKKTQDLAKYRPYIEMINDGELSPEDIKTLMDAKNGNADAIAQLAKTSGIDLFDVNENSTYKPKVEQVNYELNDIVDTIKADETYGSKVDGYISIIPDSAKEVFVKNPAVLKGFYEDTKNGIAEKVMPEVLKTLAINPTADFLQTYASVGQKVLANKDDNKASDKISDEKTKPEASRATKKKATISKGNKTAIKDHKDIWDDDDLFEEMKRKVNSM